MANIVESPISSTRGSSRAADVVGAPDVITDDCAVVETVRCSAESSLPHAASAASDTAMIRPRFIPVMWWSGDAGREAEVDRDVGTGDCRCRRLRQEPDQFCDLGRLD